MPNVFSEYEAYAIVLAVANSYYKQERDKLDPGTRTRIRDALIEVGDTINRAAEADADEGVFLRLINDTLQKQKPNVNTVWELSTAHVTQHTAAWLSTKDSDIIVRDTHGEYGWWVYVNPEPEQGDDELVPADLIVLFDHARTRGITWILLDMDAEREDDLQQWEW